MHAVVLDARVCLQVYGILLLRPLSAMHAVVLDARVCLQVYEILLLRSLSVMHAVVLDARVCLQVYKILLLLRPLSVVHSGSPRCIDCIFKLVRSPGIDSKESILPAFVAWQDGTKTLFLLGSQPPKLVLKFQHSYVRFKKDQITISGRLAFYDQKILAFLCPIGTVIPCAYPGKNQRWQILQCWSLLSKRYSTVHACPQKHVPTAHHAFLIAPQLLIQLLLFLAILLISAPFFSSTALKLTLYIQS
jgi:hypothetical protein